VTSRTAVLITHSAAVSSRVFHGAVAERRPHPRGTVLLVPPEQMVFYAVRTVQCRTFVFRTLSAPEPLSSQVPGVSPSVRLLLETRTLGRLSRLEQLLRYLERAGLEPSSLPDAFYSRLHAILSGRLPSSAKVIRSLLHQEDVRPA
jgi:hypothetical protein